MFADPLRIAFYQTELSRDGPGLLARDINRGKDPDIAAAIETIARARPDILVLQGIDWDYNGVALTALIEALAPRHALTHHYAGQPNTGVPTGLDLDGNGRTDEARDAQGYGTFTGQGGLAVLSRFPIGPVQDYSSILWQDIPGALLPWDGMPADAPDVLRLATTAHWVLTIETKDHGTVSLGAFAAGTPVFDGPEDRNGRRNHDEIAFWAHVLDGSLGIPAPSDLIIAGNANLDPDRGAGRRSAMRTLLSHPQLQDPHPGRVTVDWGRESLPDMRTSYVLPSIDWKIIDSAVAPAAGDARHRLVWVDIERR